MVYHQIDFPYTHSITRLLEICSAVKSFKDLQVVEILSPYVITAHYPGEDEGVTKEEAVEAIRLAEIVKQRILRELSELL